MRKRAKNVVILGGGAAGLSAAHELAERGFAVQVFEIRDVPGGKSRSVSVPGTAKGPRRDLPGEHGFRFFPGFYKHLPHTMQRIPFGKGNCVDNLVDTSRLEFPQVGKPPIIAPDHFPTSLNDWKLVFKDLTGHYGFRPGELEFFAERVWQILTSCQERRQDEYERLGWWEYVGAEERSEAYKKFLANGLTRSLTAAKARKASTKTMGNVFVQLMLDMITPGKQSDRVLNGPTNEVWINPWVRYLRRLGVRYELSTSFEKLQYSPRNGIITGVTLSRGGERFEVQADYYLAAVPVRVMARKLTSELLNADPTLEGICELGKYVQRMNGIQFYLREDRRLVHGHELYVDSAWSLTSISQTQFWAGYPMSGFGDGTVRGLLSVDISDWEAIGADGKCAANCTRDEIARETWRQLKRSLNRPGREVLTDDILHSWYIDPDVVCHDTPLDRDRDEDLEPMLVNNAGTWHLRPNAHTLIPNLFLAADYVQTYTDVATMEAANEAARRATNCIIEAAGSPAKLCKLWKLHEPDILIPWRANDQIRYDRGLPWDGTLGLCREEPPARPVQAAKPDPCREEELPARPIRVAVVGGGCAAIAAAFELTRPEHRGRFAVTVYQQGWRLGGKAVSGRGEHGRIEEHGLHTWMGYYENAFRLLRECYAELGRDWRDAFFPSPRLALAEEREDDGWGSWNALFPPMPGLPGDPLTAENPFSVSGYLVHAARLLAAVVESAHSRQEGGGFRKPAVPRLSPLAPEAVLAGLERLVRYGYLATLVGLAEAMQGLAALFGSWSRHPPGRGAEAAVLRPLENVASSAQRLLSELASRDDELRRVWGIVDLLLTVIRGVIRFGLVTDPRGFDAVDDYELREWLELNGASRSTLESDFLRAVAYDRLFAYEDGDPDRPRISAGQALREFLRFLFTYRGAIFWKMRASMGDVVFAPFYEALRRRGVRFEFFHHLEAVRLAQEDRLRPGERPYVESLELDVQAAVRSGSYEPLIQVRNFSCWPAQPDLSQLIDGERLAAEGWNPESFWDRRRAGQKTLRVGEDFDFVVLAVGLGVVPHVCADILARDRRWRRMVESLKLVETVAFQLWLNQDIVALGGPRAEDVILTGFVKPFDTWADMTHHLRAEAWPAGRAPRSLAYFCGPLPSGPKPQGRDDAGYLASRREVARQEAIRFLDRHMGHLWPGAVRPGGGFRWELLVTPGADRAAGPKRFETQHWTANSNPSDRYVLTVPGSAKDRISPLDNTYDNLTVAGDWTDSGFNSGCVESAMMSGRLAAHALSGCPRLEDIIGFDHP
jgi:uncharacterized protein with NAD-binding domain and iron-sulfur cluster